MPKKSHASVAVAEDAIRNYIYKCYNFVLPHSHNLGLSPNEKESCFWKTSKAVAKKR